MRTATKKRNATGSILPFNATAHEFVKALEELPSIPPGSVAVTRAGPDLQQGYTWTISFLPDDERTHEGDLPLLVVDGASDGLYGEGVRVAVQELSKGTVKAVQYISTSAAGGGGALNTSNSNSSSNNSNATAQFRLRFKGAATGRIPVGASSRGASNGSCDRGHHLDHPR